MESVEAMNLVSFCTGHKYSIELSHFEKVCGVEWGVPKSQECSHSLMNMSIFFQTLSINLTVETGIKLFLTYRQ